MHHAGCESRPRLFEWSNRQFVCVSCLAPPRPAPMRPAVFRPLAPLRLATAERLGTPGPAELTLRRSPGVEGAHALQSMLPRQEFAGVAPRTPLGVRGEQIGSPPSSFRKRREYT
ncbi:hypothetical protein ES703_55062 [subsurface metagenome]